MSTLVEAVRAGAGSESLLAAEVPSRYRASYIRAEDVDMFGAASDRDVRKSIRVGDVPMPELAPDEVLVAVMASSVNYNTVWSGTFSPVPTFEFLKRYGAQGHWEKRHDLPYHVLGSDASGVIVRVGSGVRRWTPGDHVVVSPVQVDEQEAASQADGMLGEQQRAWGYETNFGGLADFCVVRATQLIPKPPHLTWEEAATTAGCASTAYRMLISDRGARMKQGDVVLVWGAAGGLGMYAVQLIRNGGGIAVGVVSSERKREALERLGCDLVVNRTDIGIGNDFDDPAQVIEAGKRLGRIIRREIGEDPHIVFEHSGKATFGISMYVVRRGGVVVTCGSSTGYDHRYDNRYLWMKLKRLIGSHGANLQEQWECHRLLTLGKLMPALSCTYGLDELGEAARLLQVNDHIGKIGVLCLAERPGLGITDPGLRERVGEDKINFLQGV
ncbi:crotonyl-CoA carboxylase/reductase [Kitasatospora sp. NPDC049285]|uniref:crotonyl-CoA carboxylase/reductase n=1 Tax=Kitasatospora sp. NPDC049285 TaxID=3157096 RepID=UPI00344A18C5